MSVFEKPEIDLGDETQYNQCSKETYGIQKYTNFPTFREANALKTFAWGLKKIEYPIFPQIQSIFR